jgi:hypothetical protein
VKPQGFLDRLWGRVDVRGADECWLWRGSVNGRGYGRIYRDGRLQFVHRLVLEAARGAPLTSGLLAMHTCDTPRCVNPRHLVAGTHLDNMADMIRKGRHRGGPNSPARQFDVESRAA